MCIRDRYYAPGNATIALVGDIDKAATKKLVEKYFGPLKAGPKVPKPTVQTPPITAERRAVVTDRIELPRLYMAWLTPPIYTQDDANADVAASALGGARRERSVLVTPRPFAGVLPSRSALFGLPVTLVALGLVIREDARQIHQEGEHYGNMRDAAAQREGGIGVRAKGEEGSSSPGGGRRWTH